MSDKSLLGNRRLKEVAKNFYDSQPETSLVYAVLERAIMDAAGAHINGNRKDRTSALLWLLWKGEEDNHDTFSFVWCCEVLNTCPNTARKNIMRFLKSESKPWAGRASWDRIASMISNETLTDGDYDIYYEGSEIAETEVYEQEES